MNKVGRSAEELVAICWLGMDEWDGARQGMPGGTDRTHRREGDSTGQSCSCRAHEARCCVCMCVSLYVLSFHLSPQA